MVFLRVVLEGGAPFLAEESAPAQIAPTAHRLKDIVDARMLAKFAKMHLYGDRAVPGDGHGRAVFPHVNLHAHGLAPPVARTGRPQVPPAEVHAAHVLPRDRRLLEREFPQLFLEDRRAEAVERVGAGEHVPAEMRLRRALAEKRFRLELLPQPVLPVGHMEVERRMHALGAVKVDILEAAVVELRDLVCHFVLKIRVLVDVAAHGRAVFADVEDAADLAVRMRCRYGGMRAALDAEELVGRLGRVAFVGKKFAAKLQDAARLEHGCVGRRLEHPDLRDVVRPDRQRLGKGEPADLVEARVCDRRHVAALEAYVRMERMQAGADACRLYLREHGLQVCLAVGEAIAPFVVAEPSPAAYLLGNMILAERHQLETALLGVSDDLVYLIRRHASRKMVYEFLDGVAAAAFDATRQAEVAFERIHRVEERLASGRGYERGARAAQLDSGMHLAEEDSDANALLVVDVGIRRRADHADRRLFVPARVQPVAEVLPVLHGQLQHAEGCDGRDVHLEVVIGGLAVADEVLEREGHISVSRLQRHLGLVKPVREACYEDIAFAAKRARGIDGALVRMDQLLLVVERPVLGRGEQRYPQGRVNAFLAGGLDDERLYERVLADTQREVAAGYLDIGSPHRA